MRNSTFHVRVIEAQNQTIELFARKSRNLTLRQRDYLRSIGGAA